MMGGSSVSESRQMPMAGKGCLSCVAVPNTIQLTVALELRFGPQGLMDRDCAAARTLTGFGEGERVPGGSSLPPSASRHASSSLRHADRTTCPGRKPLCSALTTAKEEKTHRASA